MPGDTEKARLESAGPSVLAACRARRDLSAAGATAPPTPSAARRPVSHRLPVNRRAWPGDRCRYPSSWIVPGTTPKASLSDTPPGSSTPANPPCPWPVQGWTGSRNSPNRLTGPQSVQTRPPGTAWFAHVAVGRPVRTDPQPARRCPASSSTAAAEPCILTLVWNHH